MIQPLSNPKCDAVAICKGERRKSAKAIKGAARNKPVQLTFFDYAARVGITLLPVTS